jgi:ribonuclease HI
MNRPCILPGIIYAEPEPIVLTTDGSGTTTGNPGGWACILRYGEHVRELSGGAESTTNNLMELEAVAQGLAAITRRGAAVTVRSDSQCVIGWLSGAFEARKPHIHAAVTRILAVITEKDLRVSYAHVRGHTGDPDNERCDELAGAERQKRLTMR